VARRPLRPTPPVGRPEESDRHQTCRRDHDQRGDFRAALQDGSAYHQRIREFAARGTTVADIVRELTTQDVRDATDLFSDVHCHTRGLDGRVSIGGDPRLAYDIAATIEQAQELSRIVHRNNILIDIPATPPGLAAITAVTALGISVKRHDGLLPGAVLRRD
jgi:transaldolase